MKTNSHFSLSVLLVLLVFTGAACAPAAQPAPCPPIAGPVERAVPGESSKVRIPDKTYGYVDNPATTACDTATSWCNTSELGISKKTPVSSYVATYGCFTNRSITDIMKCSYSALAALDVSPNNRCFPSTAKPELSFDLSRDANKPTCQKPEVKTGCATWFAIYQLKDPVPAAPTTAWRYVGSATLVATNLAHGGISHFSTFVLAELPEPKDIGAGSSVLIVDSTWEEDVNGDIRVALTFQENDQSGTPVEWTLIYLFSIQELREKWPQRAGCEPPPQTNAQNLTCLFPIGTKLTITVENGMVSIDSGEFKVTFNGAMRVF